MFDDPKIQWLKRRIFGKKEPNKLLKWTCISLFWWSMFILLLMLGLGFFALLSPEDSVRFEGYSNFRERGMSFFFPYAGLHLFSLLAIALIYRRMKLGLIIYSIASLGCTFYPWIMGSEFPMTSLIFSLICVLLLVIHLGSMNTKKESFESAEKDNVMTMEERQ